MKLVVGDRGLTSRAIDSWDIGVGRVAGVPVHKVTGPFILPKRAALELVELIHDETLGAAAVVTVAHEKLQAATRAIVVVDAVAAVVWDSVIRHLTPGREGVVQREIVGARMVPPREKRSDIIDLGHAAHVILRPGSRAVVEMTGVDGQGRVVSVHLKVAADDYTGDATIDPQDAVTSIEWA